jgi:hypothetical protein
LPVRYSQIICRLERAWYKAIETLQHLQYRRERKSRGKQYPAPAPIELPITAAAAVATQAIANDVRPDFSAPSRAVEVPSRPSGPPDCI